jgi:thioredoxin-related protein
MFKILVLCVVLFYTTSASAITKLLMYNNKHCSYCAKFMKEVAVDYYYDLPDNLMEDTLELVIIERGSEPFWFVMAYNENRIKPLRGTPTFIIWNGRKELTRIYGYSSKESFYNQLDEIFNKQ